MKDLKKQFLLRSISLVVAFLFSLIAITQQGVAAASEQFVLENPVHQVAFVVKDINTARKDFAKLFGIKEPPVFDVGSMTKSSMYKNKSVEFNHQVVFIDTPTVQIEIIQPNSSQPSTMHDFLKKKGEGIHHFGTVVSDFPGKKEQLKKQLTQWGVIAGNEGEDGGYFGFFDTTKTYKTNLELVEFFTDMTLPPNEESEQPPLLGTTEIKHVGIVVKNIDQAATQYAKLLGTTKPPVVSDQKSKSVTFETPTINFKLIQPTNADSIWKKHLQYKGEGVHHLSFEIDDFDATINKLKKQGYSIIEKGTKQGTRYAYIKTTSKFKTLIEITEAN